MVVYKMGFDLLGDIKNVAGKTQSWADQEWTKRIVQVCAYGAILFYVLSSYDLIGMVDKQLTSILGIKVGKDGTRVLHALTFGLLMYVGITWLLDPLVKRLLNGKLVEGQATGTCSNKKFTTQSTCEGATPTGQWTKATTGKGATGKGAPGPTGPAQWTNKKHADGADVLFATDKQEKRDTLLAHHHKPNGDIVWEDEKKEWTVDPQGRSQGTTGYKGTSQPIQIATLHGSFSGDYQKLFDHTHNTDGTISWKNSAAGLGMYEVSPQGKQITGEDPISMAKGGWYRDGPHYHRSCTAEHAANKGVCGAVTGAALDNNTACENVKVAEKVACTYVSKCTGQEISGACVDLFHHTH